MRSTAENVDNAAGKHCFITKARGRDHQIMLWMKDGVNKLKNQQAKHDIDN